MWSNQQQCIVLLVSLCFLGALDDFAMALSDKGKAFINPKMQEYAAKIKKQDFLDALNDELFHRKDVPNDKPDVHSKIAAEFVIQLGLFGIDGSQQAALEGQFKKPPSVISALPKDIDIPEELFGSLGFDATKPKMDYEKLMQLLAEKYVKEVQTPAAGASPSPVSLSPELKEDFQALLYLTILKRIKQSFLDKIWAGTKNLYKDSKVHYDVAGAGVSFGALSGGALTYALLSFFPNCPSCNCSDDPGTKSPINVPVPPAGLMGSLSHILSDHWLAVLLVVLLAIIVGCAIGWFACQHKLLGALGGDDDDDDNNKKESSSRSDPSDSGRSSAGAKRKKNSKRKKSRGRKSLSESVTEGRKRKSKRKKSRGRGSSSPRK